MEWHWLQRTETDRLIVVFGGWALGAGPFLHLRTDANVLFAQDYRDLGCELPDEARDCSECHLVSFSFGVSAYAHWQKNRPDPFTLKVAVNGTLTPVDRRIGIAPVMMERTTNTLSQESFQQFLGRCHGGLQPQAQINVSARREELEAVAARGAAPTTRFDRIWISNQDRIFAPANQRRAWADQNGAIREIDAPHVPFDHWHMWEDLFR